MLFFYFLKLPFRIFFFLLSHYFISHILSAHTYIILCYLGEVLRIIYNGPTLPEIQICRGILLSLLCAEQSIEGLLGITRGPLVRSALRAVTLKRAVQTLAIHGAFVEPYGSHPINN